MSLINLTDAINNTSIGAGNVHGNSSKNAIIYSPWQTRTSKTIDDFWNDFIKTRLPDEKIVIDWHNLLSKYSETPGAIFPIRGGNTSGCLRRGWLVKTDDNYSYVITDNDLATYIYKMALDGFCPTFNEFWDWMTDFKPVSKISWLKSKDYAKIEDNTRYFPAFPMHFNKCAGSKNPDDKFENQQNAFLIGTFCPVCCLGKYNYKHAHIFDVRGSYNINGTTKDWNDLNKYVPIGTIKDYTFDSSIHNYVWQRHIPVNERNITRQVVLSHFFRFLDPLNHFLSPQLGRNKFTDINGEFYLDIAEYPNLQEYLIYQKSNMFNSSGNVFNDFMNRASVPSINFKSCQAHEAEEIDIVYHEKSMAVYKKGAKASKKTSSNPTSKRQSNSSTSNQATSVTGIGQYAKKVFTDLLENSKLTSAQIAQLQDKVYCKNEFGMRYAILSIKKDTRRYYATPVDGGKYYICNDWYAGMKQRIDDWLKKNNL